MTQYVVTKTYDTVITFVVTVDDKVGETTTEEVQEWLEDYTVRLTADQEPWEDEELAKHGVQVTLWSLDSVYPIETKVTPVVSEEIPPPDEGEGK